MPNFVALAASGRAWRHLTCLGPTRNLVHPAGAICYRGDPSCRPEAGRVTAEFRFRDLGYEELRWITGRGGRVGPGSRPQLRSLPIVRSQARPGARSVVGPDGGLRLARSTERQQELYWAGGSRLAALRVGDIVIRSHRLLKTRGTVVRVAVQRRGEARQVWVKWDHPDTFPNPSLESAESLEEVKGTSSPA